MDVLRAIWKGIRVVAIAVWTLLYFVVLLVYAILNGFLDEQDEGTKRLPSEVWGKSSWM